MTNQTLSQLQATRVANESNLPAVTPGFGSLQSFELMQRVAKALASSELVPQQFQGNLASCMIALDMSHRIGAAPLMTMQNLYVVHGTPAWSSKFLIATVNACGRFSSMRYEWKGEPGQNDYGCRAWTVEKETGERLNGIWVTWEMVKAEGWDLKKGSKWKTMPDQMFVYRAAAFWQRAYAPELAMGLHAAEELEDVFDAHQGPDGRYQVNLQDFAMENGVKRYRAAQNEQAQAQDVAASVEPTQSPTEAPTEAQSATQAPASTKALTPEEIAAIEAKEQAEAEQAEAGNADPEPPKRAAGGRAADRPQMNLE